MRLLDVTEQSALADGENAELILGSFLDPSVINEACRDVSAVVHLGGLSTGGYSWAEYLDINVNGTHAILEAMRVNSVPRMIYASSHHAVGFHSSNADTTVPDYAFPRPDSFYGVSKVASESLCSLYHDRHGLDAICLRIGSFRPRPNDRRTLWNWLSPDDCTRLFEAALTTPSPGYRVVWGVSANTRRIMSLDEAHAIGYVPLDNAEAFAEEIMATPDVVDPDARDFIGGPYSARTFE
jgi:uncharacterized protein YbjT (DUF2867 family)